MFYLNKLGVCELIKKKINDFLNKNIHFHIEICFFLNRLKNRPRQMVVDTLEDTFHYSLRPQQDFFLYKIQ
jgi:hypothetical protein